MTVLGYDGVTVEMPMTRTRGRLDARRSEYSVLARTTAAPPSLVAQISRRWSGSETRGDAKTSSAVTALRYRA